MSNKSPGARKLGRLIQDWERYRELVTAALAADRTTDRQEKAFLLLKAELAAQIQWLSETLPRSMAYESHQNAEAMGDLIRRHVTLASYDMDHRWESLDFESTWHEYYIYLNRLRGTDLVEPEASVPSARHAPSAPSRLANRVAWVLAFAFAGILLLAVVSAAGVGVGASGLTFTPPETLQQAADNATSAFTGMWAGPGRVIEPVAGIFGGMWVAGLIGALALFGCAMFVMRGQR